MIVSTIYSDFYSFSYYLVQGPPNLLKKFDVNVAPRSIFLADYPKLRYFNSFGLFIASFRSIRRHLNIILAIWMKNNPAHITERWMYQNCPSRTFIRLLPRNRGKMSVHNKFCLLRCRFCKEMYCSRRHKSKSDTSKLDVMQTVYNVDEIQGCFICTACRHSSKQNLTSHFLVMHEKLWAYPCVNCELKFETLQYLHDHYFEKSTTQSRHTQI